MEALKSANIVRKHTTLVTGLGTVPLVDSQAGAKQELVDVSGMASGQDAARCGLRNLAGRFRFNQAEGKDQALKP